MATISSDISAFLAYPVFGKILVMDLLTAVVFVIITHLVSKAVTKMVEHLCQRDNNPLPSASIFVNIARTTIWIIGGSIVLDSCFGINTNSLVAALGVGGIAVSLGFQDTLSNLIGGLQVTFMGIVSPGDNIEVGSESGVVQDITWRHTTIQDSLGQTVVIPNSIISKTALVHLLPANRVVVPFSVARYKDDGLSTGQTEHDIDELAELIRAEAAEAAGKVSPVSDGPRVLFSEIAELGIKGKVIFKVADANATFAAADAVVRAIARSVA